MRWKFGSFSLQHLVSALTTNRTISWPDRSGTIALTADLRQKVSSAPVFYVSTSGSDANNGLTTGTAFATIQKAVDTISIIDCNGFDPEIRVLAGSYNISSTVILKNLVGIGTKCTIKSQGGAVTLTSPATAGLGSFSSLTPTVYRLEGLTMATVAGVAFRALVFASGTILEIANCKFAGSDATSDGVDGILSFNSTVTVSGTLTTEKNFASVMTTWLSVLDMTNVTCNASAATAFDQYIWARNTGVVAYNLTSSGSSFTGRTGRFLCSVIAGNVPPGTNQATYEYPVGPL